MPQSEGKPAMEIDKQFQKLNHTRSSFENAIKKDIESIINLLKIQFDIYERGTKEMVSKDQLMKDVLGMFGFTRQSQLCSAVTKVGARCTRRSIVNSDYCKVHMYKQYISQPTASNDAKKDNTNILYMMTQADNIKGKDKDKIDGIEKTLIDGTFYYVDSGYIYDLDSFDKVGYIENGKHILTDDPFVLQ